MSIHAGSMGAKIAYVDQWIGVWRKQASETRKAIRNGVPSHWPGKLTVEDYELQAKMYEFACFGLEKMKEAIINGDV